MKKMFLKCAAALFLAPCLLAGADLTLNGAGASFPAPVYRLWTYNYTSLNDGAVAVNYQSSGSGAGINQLGEKTVDFAGSDTPLSAEELEQNNFFQFPMLTGGVVVIVNLRGVKAEEIRLDQTTLADIFLGKITHWNDPAIQSLNPGVKFPKRKITVVRRADSSGTTFLFTDYLSKISPEWKEKVGSGPAVNWPVGIGGQKNPGVCNNVAKINGAIGYTEYTYALEAGLKTVTLRNRAGKFIAPSPEAFAAGVAGADWKNAPGFRMVLTDPDGEQSWPITGVTYILVRRDQPSAEQAKALFDYFNWCFTSGSAGAAKLHYVPLPADTVQLIRDKWQQEIQWPGR